MDSKFVSAQFRSAVAAVVMIVVASVVPFKARAQAVSLDPAKMPRIGNVDERFVSYNIEMAEVTGGNFWKPYHNQSFSGSRSDTASAICFHSGRHEPEHVPVSSTD